MNKNILALIGISLISFVDYMDYTVVSAALPTIQTVFKVSILDLQWIFNIYSIVIAASMIICGRLGDLYGQRLVFYMGALCILLGSLGAGFAENYEWLLFFRAVQSVGVAITCTLAPGLIHGIFGDKAHNPMSFYGTVLGLGLTVGPTIGGLLVTYIGWRWVFFINIPVLALALALALPFIPKLKSPDKIPLDFLGAGLLVIALVSLIYGITNAEQAGWSNPLALCLFLIFIISAPLLVYIENRQAHPIIHFQFFTRPVFLLAVLACTLGGALISSFLFFGPLFLQRVMAYTPNQAGLALLAMPVAILFLGPFVGKITQLFTPRKVLYGIPFVALLSVILHLIFSITPHISIAIASFFVVGIAWAFINTTTAMGAISVVKPSETGVAIGTVFSFWNISAAVGIAIGSVIFNHLFNSHQSLGYISAFTVGFRGVFIFLVILLIIMMGISTWAFRKK